MRWPRCFSGLAVVFGLFEFSLIAHAAPIVVDDLGTTPSSHISTSPEVFVSNDAGGGILGGTRDVTLSVNAATSVANAVAYEISGGQLSFASGPLAQGTLELFYDAGGAGLGLDVSGMQLNVTFVAFDHANDVDLPVVVTLSDGVLTDSETLYLTQSVQVGIDTPVTLSFLAASFGVDLTNIQSLKILFDAKVAHDFTVQGEDGVTITSVDVPEPSSLILWGSIALAGGWFMRRRLMKSAA